MIITEENIRLIMPLARSAAVYAPMLTRAIKEFSIDSPLRAAAFLAQVAHESTQLNRTDENLNYSAEALHAKFNKYFSALTDMSYYHRQPERIANRIYANRMGNGDEQSGDGWKYRGHGLIQLTGRYMFEQYQAATGVPVLEQPGLLLMAPDAARSAAWFWATNGLNELADAGNFIRITRRINGGTDGLTQRQAFYSAAKQVFGI